MRKWLIVFLSLLLLLSPLTALGATNQVTSSEMVQPYAYQLIADGGCQLSNNGNGNISISGDTSTYYPVTEVGLTLNLQYLSNGNWYTLQSYSYTANNTSYKSGGQKLSVSRGYYYRVLAEHTAYNGSTYETGFSYTEAVYVQ
ncbi:hypothetical protein DesLBE_4841 [Desulfitobacterium sp. LBE]|uniref:Uncharacterized protein n=2 Tax=root TaxID=1 RepID=A0A098B306_DESHA|nr:MULTISPECIES: hypothetical protein [Desulfitobacterium]KTE90168.1 hypothetical protein AT727_09580 [Desulfitobacterium hafniense]MEA5024774.1 hypothetical protein [Desulfitobacterium hafniense]TWH60404.1 hypothetical protein DesLBE_4841 [Desulfitobacterium sp. LBE]CDX02740.1 Hypothetical protein DPCES_2853 [Desulfitobacterium hafniense]